MKRFLGILQFLTRIPIPIQLGLDDAFYKSLVYFPLVGWVLGLMYYGIGALGLLLFNKNITAIIILSGTVILTGGLHLDGVGDTFDGLYSYRSKERILEIMKDSRLGTNALLAIVFLLLFKLAFIYSLLESNNLWSIMIMPIYGRISSMWACYKTKTPRATGMGNIFIGKATLKILLTAVSYGMALVFGILFFSLKQAVMGVLYHAAILIILLILIRWFIKNVYKKIDGVTGDILGAICEFGELIYLIGIYLAAAYL